MYHAIASPTAHEQHISSTHSNVFTRFFQWAGRQEEKRFMWLAFAFIFQIGLALPLTLLSVVTMGGNNFNLWLIACITNVPSLALCLAAQPTKVILPVLFLAWLADAAIILYCVAGFFAHSA